MTMDRLRDCFVGVGLTKVETFIASGNVIFECAARPARPLERKIEKHLHATLGYDVATFLRTPADVAAVAAYAAFPPESGQCTLSIGFIADEPAADARRALAALRTDMDEFTVVGREFYWLCRTRTSDSTITGKKLERALGLPFTVRNATTVRRLAAKYSADD